MSSYHHHYSGDSFLSGTPLSKSSSVTPSATQTPEQKSYLPSHVFPSNQYSSPVASPSFDTPDDSQRNNNLKLSLFAPSEPDSRRRDEHGHNVIPSHLASPGLFGNSFDYKGYGTPSSSLKNVNASSASPDGRSGRRSTRSDAPPVESIYETLPRRNNNYSSTNNNNNNVTNNNNNNNSNNNSNNNNNNNNSNNNNNNKEVSFASPSTDTPVTKSTGSSFLGKISSSTAPQGGSSYSSPAARSSTRSSTSSGPVHTDRRWVTVFGFVSTEVAAILRKFQSYGEIIHHHQEQGKNWVHIQFQTDLQAENALNRNGKLISDGMMIGVVPCSDQAAMSGGAKASVMLANTARRSAVNDPVAQGLSDYSVTITQSNQGPLPHKSLWSKIQEYVFDA